MLQMRAGRNPPGVGRGQKSETIGSGATCSKFFTTYTPATTCIPATTYTPATADVAPHQARASTTMSRSLSFSSFSSLVCVVGVSAGFTGVRVRVRAANAEVCPSATSATAGAADTGRARLEAE